MCSCRYAAGGGKRNMANFVQEAGPSSETNKFRPADVHVNISCDIMPKKSQFYICRCVTVFTVLSLARVLYASERAILARLVLSAPHPRTYAKAGSKICVCVCVCGGGGGHPARVMLLCIGWYSRLWVPTFDGRAYNVHMCGVRIQTMAGVCVFRFASLIMYTWAVCAYKLWRVCVRSGLLNWRVCVCSGLLRTVESGC